MEATTDIRNVLKPGFYVAGKQLYLDTPGLSASGIKALAKSPAHFKAMDEKEETQAMVFGDAYHAYMLELNRFHKEFIVRPEDLNARTKEGKAWIEEAEANGLQVLTYDEGETLKAMSDALHTDPRSAAILNHIISPERALIEVAVFWYHYQHQFLCKAKIDILLRKELTIPTEVPVTLPPGTVIDLKSTVDASDYGFPYQAWKLGYGIQAGWYLQGMTCATNGTPHETFCFLAQEKTPPYAINLFVTPPEVVLEGQKISEEMANRYQECRVGGFWPGYDQKRLGIWTTRKSSTSIIE